LTGSVAEVTSIWSC